MLDAFWSGVGEELAKNWVTRILSPAFAFWVGGAALVWWSAHGAGVAARGWDAEVTATAVALGQVPVVAQVVLVIGVLVIVAASAVVAERLTTPLLRLLEGYWTRPAVLRAPMVRWRQRRFDKVTTRADPLLKRQLRGELSPTEFMELLSLRAAIAPEAVRLDALQLRADAGLDSQQRAQLGRDLAWLRTTPARDDMRMPTRLGDVLRAAQYRPQAAYGIDAVICWDALWPLLPAEMRTELTQTRAALNGAVRSWLWGALFLVWTPFSCWAVLVGVGLPLLSHWFGLLPRAAAFGAMTVTCFDLYRMRLYDAMGVARPVAPEQERQSAGPQLTAALWGTSLR